MRGKSQKRLELGEKKWQEIQRDRNRKKARKWYRCHSSNTSTWRLRAKQELLKYKGGKCQKCGYNKDVPGAYVFHHRNPMEKEFMISRYRRSIESLKKEADKCDLLCANCHAEVHDIERKLSRKAVGKEYRLRQKKLLKKRKCLKCYVEFKPRNSNQKYCQLSCSVRRKVKHRPTASELQELLKSYSWVAVGRKYGVSDNAVRKWARKYGVIT